MAALRRTWIVAWCLLAATATVTPETPQYGYQVVHVYPHDRAAFTQGLEFRAGFLYEGTGLEGQSTLRKVRLETGKVEQQINLAPEFFGEGITVVNQQIIQLTWRSQIGFAYEQSSFRRLRSFKYPGEGWGLTNDGSQIYMSDGSAQIRCWDAGSLLEKRRFTVRDAGRPISLLNELEYVQGEIYANVWQSDRVVRFSPVDGKVLGWVDLSGLLSAADRTEQVDVLNGIAYDSLGDRLFVTGKLWPKLFEIRVVRKSATPR